MDKRLAEMPGGLSEEEKSNYIKQRCNLKDAMYELVNVMEKKERGMPLFSCLKCGKLMTGGPQKIRSHNLPDEKGAETCLKLDEGFRKKAAEHLAAELAAKEKRAAEKKRKELAEMAARARSEKLKQLKIGEVLDSDLSKEGLDKLWSHVVYAAPTSMNLMENPFFVKAVEATSRYMLSQADKERLRTDPGSVPGYKPPSHNIVNSTLKPTVRETTAQLTALQAIEAVKYGVSGTSDGWSSNPGHRPVEAQLFETPTITMMNQAEDLSGTVKSEPNIALKLGTWADTGLALMNVCPPTLT